MLLPAPIAPGLFALSIVLALVAAYGAFEVAERVHAVRGSTRVVWIVAGGFALGVAFWGMQYVGTLAYGLPQAMQLYAPLTTISRFIAVVVTGAALAAAGLLQLNLRERLVLSPAIGAGVVAVHVAGIAATAGRAATLWVDWPFLLLLFAWSTFVVAAGLQTIVRVRAMRDTSDFPLRLAGGIGLGLAINAAHMLGMWAIRVNYATTRQPVDPNQYLIAVVVIVAFALSSAAIVTARFSRRISGERARTEHLAHLYTRERRSTLALQSALLPSTLPTVDGLEFSTSYVPSTMEDAIGGDWFDAFAFDDGRIAVSIGDAAGHGTTAAIAMNVVRQAMRNAVLDHSDPADVLTHANRAILASERPSIVTALFGVIDPATLAFTFASAGHPAPLLGRADGTVNSLAIDTGIPLGIFSPYSALTSVVSLPPDAMLVLFTDGVIEHHRDVVAGLAALERAVARVCARRLPEPAREIDRAIFADDQRIDDSAIMTVRTLPVLRSLDLQLPATGNAVPHARTAMRRFIASLETSDDIGYGILVAVGEAVSNAIEHAYNDEAEEHRIWLRARKRGRYAEVTVEDRGRWRSGNGNPERGWGLAFMRAFANTMAIDDLPAGTRVALRFSLDTVYVETS